MNKIRLTVCGISFFFLTVLFSRCHKSGNSTSSRNDSSCLVASEFSISNGVTYNTTFTYNDQRRLIEWRTVNKTSFTTSTDYQTFRYGPGYLITSKVQGSGPALVDSIVLNPNGSIAAQYVAGVTFRYTYAANGEVLQDDAYRPWELTPNAGDTTIFTWSDGDCIRLFYGTDPDIYTYDITKNAVPGDYAMLSRLFQYGNVAYTFLNKHLQTGYDSTRFNYVFDASGKVISYATTATSLITYACP